MNLVIDAAVIALIVSLISIAGAVVKVTNAVANLRQSITEVDNKIDQLRADGYHEVERLTLFANGNRERIEHINTRISNQQRDLTLQLSDIETFLVKTTAYEKRRNF